MASLRNPFASTKNNIVDLTMTLNQSQDRKQYPHQRKKRGRAYTGTIYYIK
jgi:hypothetical protein